MIHIWRPWKVSNFQDSPPPLSIYVQNYLTPLTLDVQFQTILPPLLQMILYMWTNEIKTKAKSNHITLKFTMRSILRFSPKNNAMLSLKDGFTVWRQKLDFLSIILMFGSAWCLVMVQTRISLIKKIKCPEHSLIPYPLHPITCHFCLNLPPPLKVEVICV